MFCFSLLDFDALYKGGPRSFLSSELVFLSRGQKSGMPKKSLFHCASGNECCLFMLLAFLSLCSTSMTLLTLSGLENKRLSENQTGGSPRDTMSYLATNLIIKDRLYKGLAVKL